MRSPRNSTVDAISNLPTDVIDKILACLPLRDAVRTSMLSREWRYKWMSIPELVFDYRFDKAFLPYRGLERIIYQVLLHHQKSINKFALQVPSYRSSPDVDHWILFLTKYNVQDFTLHLCSGNKHKMPSHFFAFQHLRHLNLYKCVFEPPPRFQGFRRLVTLDYQDVDFVPKIFGHFISQCWLLERMRLVDCTDFNSLEVEAPSLRFFTFHGVFKSIRLKNCPVLSEVSLSTPIYGYTGIQSSNWIKHFDFLPTLEKLHLQPRLLQVVHVKYTCDVRFRLMFFGIFCPKFLFAGVSHRLPNSFNRLKFLNLSMYLDNIEEVARALCLFRRAPNLQTLKITLYATNTVKAVVEFIRAQKTPGRLFNQLKRVDMSVFCCSLPQMEFTKFLLASATALEDGRYRLMNVLKQFPRASPKALICISNL